MTLNGATEAAYRYTALGQQVGRDVGGVVTVSVHDLAGNRIAEHDGAGAVIREYIWLDGRPLAVVEGGQTYWLHWDHIGRPVLATDSAGAVVWAARYLPFGGIDQVSVDIGAIEQNLRFPGQWFQSETGLHQNWHRDYDPTTGRYLQADPLGLVDGPSVYGYVRQSPVRWIDPEGLDCRWVFDAGIGAEIMKCDRESDLERGVCPSGDCASRDPRENNTEYEQCMDECNTAVKSTGRFVVCTAAGQAVGISTGTGFVGSATTSTVCKVVVKAIQCDKPCFEKTCKGGRR